MIKIIASLMIVTLLLSCSSDNVNFDTNSIGIKGSSQRVKYSNTDFSNTKYIQYRESPCDIPGYEVTCKPYIYFRDLETAQYMFEDIPSIGNYIIEE